MLECFSYIKGEIEVLDISFKVNIFCRVILIIFILLWPSNRQRNFECSNAILNQGIIRFTFGLLYRMASLEIFEDLFFILYFLK